MRRFAVTLFITLTALLAFAVLASCCTARASGVRAVSGVSGTEFTFRGRLVMMGNVPHTFFGIRTEDESKTYAFVTTASKQEILALKGHLVEFVAIPVSAPDAAAAGEARLYLKGETIRLVSWKIVD